VTERPALSISVVIPTLDEGSTIARALRHARSAFGRDAELIVADGGSRDRTPRIARGNARVVTADRGRGQQLRAGAEVATGELVVFLHADTRVEERRAARALAVFQDLEVVAACYRFAVDPPARRFSRYALLERAVNWRTRLFHTATGDQVIVTRRAALEQLGGVPPIPLFEDVLLVRRLRRLGRFVRLDATARTSRRRWEERGFWPTVLEHWALRIAFWLRFPPDRLARWYTRRSVASGPAGDRVATAGPASES
jgi:rSAM/selenodomain-associated transferase 2